MMVHVDESFSFHTSRNSYVNFDLISFPDLTLPTETNDIPENLKKIIRVKASRPLVLCIFGPRLNSLAICPVLRNIDGYAFTHSTHDIKVIVKRV